MRISRGWFAVAVVGFIAVAMSATSSTQNLASAKVVVSAGEDEVMIQGPGPMMILEGNMKTSSVGDLVIGVSLECALWTGTSTSGSKGGPKQTSTSRAAVNVTVVIDDDHQATPGQVVYCDREQKVSFVFASEEIVATDEITLELFLATKNANHFNFYTENPGSGVHNVKVYASGILTPDPNAPVDSTRAVVGKRTLVIDEYNSGDVQ